MDKNPFIEKYSSYPKSQQVALIQFTKSFQFSMLEIHFMISMTLENKSAEVGILSQPDFTPLALHTNEQESKKYEKLRLSV